MAIYPDNGRDPLIEAASKAMAEDFQKSNQSNAANINILHITAVEGLAAMINEHLGALTENITEQHTIKLKAMQNLAEWQAKDLHELRKVYE